MGRRDEMKVSGHETRFNRQPVPRGKASRATGCAGTVSLQQSSSIMSRQPEISPWASWCRSSAGRVSRTPSGSWRRPARPIRAKHAGNQVIVVVSRPGQHHRRPDRHGRARSPTTPSAREMDMLLATGEQISIALMAMAIQELGEKAVSFTGPQIGIVTDSTHSKARIKNIDTAAAPRGARRRQHRRRRRLPGHRRTRRHHHARPRRLGHHRRRPRRRDEARRVRGRRARSTPTWTASTPPTRGSCPTPARWTPSATTRCWSWRAWAPASCTRARSSSPRSSTCR